MSLKKWVLRWRKGEDPTGCEPPFVPGAARRRRLEDTLLKQANKFRPAAELLTRGSESESESGSESEGNESESSESEGFPGAARRRTQW